MPYLIVGLLTFGDAFLSVLPNETALTAFAALAVATGTPNLFFLGVVAAVSAILGDIATYLLGRKVGTDRFGWMRSSRAQLAVAWARRSLDRRAWSVIVVARYIPFGKFAVSVTAGASQFGIARYVPRVILSCLIWSTYHTLLGAAFGGWLHANPPLAVILAGVVGIVLGLLLDRLAAVIERRTAGKRTSR